MTLDSVDAAKKFVEDNEVVVVGFFAEADSDAAKAFNEVAGANDDYKFGLGNADVAAEYKVCLKSWSSWSERDALGIVCRTRVCYFFSCYY